MQLVQARMDSLWQRTRNTAWLVNRAFSVHVNLRMAKSEATGRCFGLRSALPPA